MFTLVRDLTQPPHFSDDAIPVQSIRDLPKDIILVGADYLASPGRGGIEYSGYTDLILFHL